MGNLMQTGGFKSGERAGVWNRYRPDGAPYDEGRCIGERNVGE